MADTSQRVRWSVQQLLSFASTTSSDAAQAVCHRLVNNPELRDTSVLRPVVPYHSAPIYQLPLSAPALLDPNIYPLREQTTMSENQKAYRKSPTPSTIRRRAHELLREHGSPPGKRVTAGGRIVPDSGGLAFQWQAPPRKFWYDSTQHSNTVDLRHLEGCLVQVGEGVIGTIVNGAIQLAGPGTNNAPYPVNVPPNFGQISGKMAPPIEKHNYAYTSSVRDPEPIQKSNTSSVHHVDQMFSNVPVNRHIQSLKNFQDGLQKQLKSLDRSEVLNQDKITSNGKAAIVEQRRSLIGRIDEARRSIKSLEDRVSSGAALRTSTDQMSANENLPLATYFPEQHAMDGSLQSATLANEAGYTPIFNLQGSMLPFAPPMIVPPGMTSQDVTSSIPQGYWGYAPLPTPHFFHPHTLHEAMPIYTTPAGAPGAPISDNNMSLDGTFHTASQGHGRRSHAVEIKNPSEASRSTLNPKSPIYEPAERHDARPPSGASGSFCHGVATVCEALAQKGVNDTNEPGKLMSEQMRLHHALRETSSSTAGTEAFFPFDAEQHSGTKLSHPSRDPSTGLSAWLRKENIADLPPNVSISEAHMVSSDSRSRHEQSENARQAQDVGVHESDFPISHHRHPLVSTEDLEELSLRRKEIVNHTLRRGTVSVESAESKFDDSLRRRCVKLLRGKTAERLREESRRNDSSAEPSDRPDDPEREARALSLRMEGPSGYGAVRNVTPASQAANTHTDIFDDHFWTQNSQTPSLCMPGAVSGDAQETGNQQELAPLSNVSQSPKDTIMVHDQASLAPMSKPFLQPSRSPCSTSGGNFLMSDRRLSITSSPGRGPSQRSPSFAAHPRRMSYGNPVVMTSHNVAHASRPGSAMLDFSRKTGHEVRPNSPQLSPTKPKDSPVKRAASLAMRSLVSVRSSMKLSQSSGAEADAKTPEDRTSPGSASGSPVRRKTRFGFVRAGDKR